MVEAEEMEDPPGESPGGEQPSVPQGTEASTSRSEGEDPLVGRLIAQRFKVLERVAAGGMGVVYKAEQLPLGRVVALKVLETAKNPEVKEDFKRRFFLEAAAASKLSHQNTIVVHDYGSEGDDLYFIAVEFLLGGTLHRYLRKKGVLTPAQAIHVGAQVCASLADAHHAGLVHRDVKPGNIMFSPRRKDPFYVKVVDFGLVKIVSGDDKESMGLTQSGVMMGSPRYMAPEQVRALDIDNRTDIYAFGATLYHMVAGVPPFHTGKAFDAMAGHVAEAPPPLRETWPDCQASEQLESVIMRCLEKNPDNRYQSMDEVHEDLLVCADEVRDGFSSGPLVSYTGLPALHLGEEDSNPSADSLREIARRTGTDPGASGPRDRAAESGFPTATAVPTMSKPVPEGGGRGPLGLVAAGLVVLIGLGVGLALALVPDESTADATEVTTPLEVPGASDPEPDPTPADEGTVLDSSTLAARPEPEPLVEITSDPPGATVTHGDETLGTTPVFVFIPEGESWEVTLTLEGYRPREESVTSESPELSFDLTRMRGGRGSRESRGSREGRGQTAPEPPTPTPEPTRPRVVTPDLPSPWD